MEKIVSEETERMRIMLDIFGFRKEVKKQLMSERLFAFDQLIRKGFTVSVYNRIKSALGLTDLQFASALDRRPAALKRHFAAGKRLPLAESDRIFRIVYVFSFACFVFDSAAAAKDWLLQPQFSFGGRIPFEVMWTEAGAREVEDLLGRIQHGIVA